MSQVLAIFWAKLRMTANEIASVRHEAKLKVIVVTVFAAGLWLGAYGFFYGGFRWLIRFGGDAAFEAVTIGDIIMARMLGVLTLAVFFMLIFSNVLVSFSTLYRAREVEYLLQTPVSFRTFFIARFWECVGFSSWALGFLGSPLILAYGVTSDAPWTFYVAAAAFFLPFITIPAAIGCAITLVLARVFPRQRVRVMIGLAAIAVGLLFIYIQDILNVSRLSQDAVLTAVMDATAQTQSPFLPSYWATRGVLAAVDHDYRECLFQFMLLASNALLCVWAATELAHRIFYQGYSFLAGQDRTRIRPVGKGILGRLESGFRWLPNPARALVVKDIKLFWRDPAQWSQFVIFFGILAIYIANLHGVGRGRYTTEMWRSWIACLNIASCTLVLATLTSRFVFPLVSLEGRRFWILGLAPLRSANSSGRSSGSVFAPRPCLPWAWRSSPGTCSASPPIHFWLSVYSVVIANFGLAGLAVGLGTLYPNFHEDNPARIVSSMGGTLNFLLSVAYITVIIVAQTVILQWRAIEHYTRPETFWWALAIVLVGITLLSIVTALVPLYFGLRNLNTMEF